MLFQRGPVLLGGGRAFLVFGAYAAAPLNLRAQGARNAGQWPHQHFAALDGAYSVALAGETVIFQDSLGGAAHGARKLGGGDVVAALSDGGKRWRKGNCLHLMHSYEPVFTV
ncbi:hypothetical protein NC77_14330 [Janthinobacterium lividum]|nr:hypothetical protein NC77_14330 [Janthinobacterium lividum]